MKRSEANCAIAPSELDSVNMNRGSEAIAPDVARQAARDLLAADRRDEAVEY